MNRQIATRAAKRFERLAYRRRWFGPIYLKLFSGSMGREERALTAGIAEYYRATGTGRDLYLLRRNIHMLEKGLTMQPRRDTFATEYISQTVESFREMVSARADASSRPAEIGWMWAVLSDYFQATSTSTNPVIADARLRYGALSALAGGLNSSSGPHAPKPAKPSVDIAELSELATGRRSVRWFLPKPVERSLIDAAVSVGMESPTACNRQPYRLEIFDRPEDIAKVSAIPMGTNGYRDQIPGLMVLIGDLSAFFDPRDRHLIYVDSCLAATGILLGLEAQGIGSCCVNWPDIPAKEKAMSNLLGLKPHERVIMLIAYGYTNEDSLVPFSAKQDINTVRSYPEL